jgi:hypothetical protein
MRASASRGFELQLHGSAQHSHFDYDPTISKVKIHNDPCNLKILPETPNISEWNRNTYNLGSPTLSDGQHQRRVAKRRANPSFLRSEDNACHVQYTKA